MASKPVKTSIVTSLIIFEGTGKSRAGSLARAWSINSAQIGPATELPVPSPSVNYHRYHVDLNDIVKPINQRSFVIRGSDFRPRREQVSLWCYSMTACTYRTLGMPAVVKGFVYAGALGLIGYLHLNLAL